MAQRYPWATPWAVSRLSYPQLANYMEDEIPANFPPPSNAVVVHGMSGPEAWALIQKKRKEREACSTPVP